jgi:hypothetical protein
MFLLGIIGFLVIIFFIFLLVRANAEKKTYGMGKTDYLVVLNKGIETNRLTDLQNEVVDFLKSSGNSSEVEIKYSTRAGKSVLTSLYKKGVIEKEIDNSKRNKRLVILIAGILVLGLAMFFANYYLLIRFNLRYFGIIFYIFIFVLIVMNVIFIYRSISEEARAKINALSVFGLIAFMGLFFIFGGRPFIHAEDYSNLIEVDEADFIEEIQTVDIETLPLVDKAYGYKLGQLKLGEYPGIGSEFEAGEYSDIIYQGKQYLVAPLEYRGIFKWLSNNKVGTPGYILIDKVTAETQFVNLREDTGEGLLYTPTAYFNQDLVRHAYYNGLSKYQLENQFFEIDDDGNPYYVLQYSLPTIFINGGHKINKVAVVNALNGEVNVYSPGEEPDWVESVYPDSLIFNQLSYWGALQDGWLNSVFAQKGVLQPSSGTRVIMNEGELYYFTGLTSAGNDESTIGFLYAGMKTKETRVYRFPGATEEAAMNKVLTLLAQNNISTSFPIPLNVEDVPTYFILIKGDDGRILRYVYVSVQDLELISMAETDAEAYNNYLVRLSSTNSSSITEITGPITDIVSYVSNGSTIYWVEIDDGDRYKVNVSGFSDLEMSYFTSLVIGDSITINVLGYNVVSITTP